MTGKGFILSGLMTAIGLLTGWAQTNFVPNPGFEMHYGLPDGEGNLFKLKGWFNPSGGTSNPFGTPDFLHLWGINQAKLPNSYYGTVSPHDSNGIAGFLAYAAWKPDAREYLATPLVAPLQQGKSYRFSMWITNGSANFYTGGSIAGLGVRFSTKKPQQFYSRPISLEPQLLCQEPLFDTTWHRLSWTFVATDTFTFLTIGNFLPDSLTPYTHVKEGVATGAYYFVDDVLLEEMPETITQIPEIPQPTIAQNLDENHPPQTGPATLSASESVPGRIGDRRVMRPQRLVVASDTVRLLVYDPRAEDGDSISLAWNGQWLLNEHKVKNKPTEFTVILENGKNNTLIFYAHNLGNVPPNTAVVAYDAPDGTRTMVEVRNDLKRSGAIEIIRRR